MTTTPASQASSDPPAGVSKQGAADSYAVLVAQQMLADFTLRYARLFEDLSVGVDSCQRRIQVMFRLPTLDSLAWPHDQLAPPDRIIIPMTIMRRGQMYTHLTYKAAGDCTMRIVSRRTSNRLLRSMLDLRWHRVTAAMSDAGSDYPQAEIDKISAGVSSLLTDVVSGSARDAREAVGKIQGHYDAATPRRGSHNRLVSSAYRDFMQLAHRLSRRHIIWIELTKRTPGDVVEFEYTYSTRFASEYRHDSQSHGRLRRAYESWKRWVGQPPSVLRIPISRHALATSYHVTYQAPEHCFIDRFDFVDLSPSGASASQFATRATKSDAQLNGQADVGGGIGHLYCHEMPHGPRTAVRAKVMERPPGATASVAWLCTASAALTLALIFSWDNVFRPDPPRIVPVLLPLPGIAALWFAHVFHGDSRRRLPVAARLGLYTTMTMTILTMILILASNADPAHGDSPLPAWVFISVAAVLQLPTLLLAWHQRIHFHRRYQQHQSQTASSYGL